MNFGAITAYLLYRFPVHVLQKATFITKWVGTITLIQVAELD